MSSRIICGRYELGHTLGKGIEGKVKICRDIDTDELVAIKFIDAQQIRRNARAARNLRREIDILTSLEHDNIIKLLHYEDSVDYPRKCGSTREVIMLVTELAAGGELFAFLSETSKFPEAVAREFFRQLVSGLLHCHENGVSHRDLKPENLFLSADFQIKIGDFGLSHLTEDGCETAHRYIRTVCGTRAYMAPEIIERVPYRGEAVDVWSAGVILFILLTGFPPLLKAQESDWYFLRLKNKEHEYFWGAHERNHTFNPMVKDLILKLLDPNEHTRISLADILDHPWMTDTGIGRALTSAEFAADMSRRKAAVDAARDAKRREKLAKQRAQDSKYAASYEFDTFQYAESHAVRNLSTEGENAYVTTGTAMSDEAATAATTAANAEFIFKADAELMPSTLPGSQRNTFTCGKEPAAVFTAIVRGLEKMQANEEREARAAADVADTFDVMDTGEGCAFINDEDEEALKSALPTMTLATADEAAHAMTFKAKPSSWKINVTLPCNAAMEPVQLAVRVYKAAASEQHAVVHVTRRAGPSLQMSTAMSTVENLVLKLMFLDNSTESAAEKGDTISDARDSHVRSEIENL